MVGSETHFNRKKENYLARKRNKERQKKSHIPSTTIDSKKARQIKLWDRKQKRKEEKKKLKESKMQVE
jgi:hypothetical protein